MPIRPYLEGEFFEPETIKNMGVAFEHVRKEIGLRERDDPLNRIVARAIIETAQRGVHDAKDLALSVMHQFQSPPPPSPRARLSAWSAMDDFYLRNEIKIGRRTNKIADALGREVEDVRKRAAELGLALPDDV